MAPALVDTPTPQPVSTKAPTNSKISEGFNKEFFIGYESAYDHKDEVKGTGKQPPATYPNYLPVWDNEYAR
jgi:sulfonate dioxygenase